MTTFKNIVTSKPFFIIAVSVAALIVPTIVTVIILHSLQTQNAPVSTKEPIDTNSTIDSFVTYTTKETVFANSTVLKAPESKTNALYIHTESSPKYLGVSTSDFATISSAEAYDQVTLDSITSSVDTYMKDTAFVIATDDSALPNTLRTYTNDTATCALQGAVSLAGLTFSCTTSQDQQVALTLTKTLMDTWPKASSADTSYGTLQQTSDDSSTHSVAILSLADASGERQKYTLIFTKEDSKDWEYISDASDASDASASKGGGKYIMNDTITELSNDATYGPLLAELLNSYATSPRT